MAPKGVASGEVRACELRPLYRNPLRCNADADEHRAPRRPPQAAVGFEVGGRVLLRLQADVPLHLRRPRRAQLPHLVLQLAQVCSHLPLSTNHHTMINSSSTLNAYKGLRLVA